MYLPHYIRLSQSLLVISLLLLIIPTSGFSDNRDKQSGFIELELKDKKTARTYEEMVDSLMSKLEAADQTVGNIQSDSSVPKSFDRGQLYYLTAVHLHCTFRAGACTIIPAALLEIDLIRSVRKNKVSCSNLTPFWKSWIEYDMERRVDLSIKVSNISKRSTYKKKIRPKYLKCSAYINKLLEGNEDQEAFLAARYKDDSRERKATSKLIAYLKKLNTKIPDIFNETNLPKKTTEK